MKTSTTNKLLTLGTLIGTGFLLVLSNCSGGGGGSTTVKSTLNESTVQTLASNIVLEGDCRAISGVLMASTNPNKLAITSDMQSTESVQRSYPLDSTTYGLVSGSVRKHGEHDDGTTALTYEFNNFTNPTGDLQVGINGSASVVDHGKPSDYGPILSHKTIDSQGPMTLNKASYSRATNGTYEVELDGYTQVYSQVLFESDNFEVKNAVARNTATNEIYRISNLSAEGYLADEEMALTNVKTEYTDPEIGTIFVESELIRINRDSMQLPASIEGSFTLTATDGTQAEATVTESGNIKIYTAGVLTSEVDCSNLVH